MQLGRSSLSSAFSLRRVDWRAPLALVLIAFAAVLMAQIEGERGVPPIASTGDFEMADIQVDTAGPTADKARQAGWRLAQRLGWRKLWIKTNGGAAPNLSDSQLDAIVSGIEVQKEQIGPHRYIATLGVSFDRARAGAILGVRGTSLRSPPLLVIPVQTSAGVSQVFENITEWQKAWARFRTGESAIDYVRTSGNGPDALLLNAGQTTRRGRLWWRAILDQYGAADVVMPFARIEYSYPGGPVVGRFSARYGPDNKYLGSFTVRAPSPNAIPDMMDKAVRQMDMLYTRALTEGVLQTDPSLVIEEPVEIDNMAEAVENATAPALIIDPAVLGAQSFQIQFDTPDAAAVGAGEAAMRAIPGMRSANTTSLALGGTSVMSVTFEGSADTLRAALQARGYTVTAAGNTLRIVRR